MYICIWEEEKIRGDQQEGNLQNSSCPCVGSDTIYLGSSFRILLGDPDLPGFPRGCILSGEGYRGNLIIANLSCLRTIGGEHLKIGIGSVDVTIEEIPAEGFTGFQRECDITPIIERQLHGICELSESRRLKYTTFR